MDNQVSSPVSEPTPTKNNNLLMSILAYIGPFVLVSYAVAKDNPTVKFHIKQGLVLLVIEAGVWIVDMMFGSFFWPIIRLAHLALIILSIIGIVNAINNKEKQLPFVGHFSEKFHI